MKVLASGLTLALFALLPTSAAAQTSIETAPPPPVTGMASGILIDASTKKILWAREDQTPRAPASLTKILTALVVIENAKLNATAVITPEARTAPGGRLYAELGWTFTIEDLLWGLLLQSGNDAAVALGQAVAPDLDSFMKMMNDRARKIGAVNSTFMNPHGYDQPGHTTTARDLALITVAALKNPTFAKMVGTKSQQITWGDGQPRIISNHNKLLWRYPDTIGVKTGFTDESGHSLASAVRRNNTTLVVITLNSPDHYAESIALYDWAFPNLAALRANPAGIIQEAKPARRTLDTGLKIIEIDPTLVRGSVGAGPWSAPLLVPILSGALALLLGTLVIRRRTGAET